MNWTLKSTLISLSNGRHLLSTRSSRRLQTLRVDEFGELGRDFSASSGSCKEESLALLPFLLRHECSVNGIDVDCLSSDIPESEREEDGGWGAETEGSQTKAGELQFQLFLPLVSSRSREMNGVNAGRRESCLAADIWCTSLGAGYSWASKSTDTGP